MHAIYGQWLPEFFSCASNLQILRFQPKMLTNLKICCFSSFAFGGMHWRQIKFCGRGFAWVLIFFLHQQATFTLKWVAGQCRWVGTFFTSIPMLQCMQYASKRFLLRLIVGFVSIHLVSLSQEAKAYMIEGCRLGQGFLCKEVDSS